MNATKPLNLRATTATLFATALLPLSAGAKSAASVRYGLQEGEPLFYALRLAASHEVVADVNHFEARGKTKQTSSVDVRIDCQLMPIVQETNGEWKLRVVLDQVVHTASSADGTKTKRLDGESLRHAQIDPIAVLKVSMREPMPLRDSASTNSSDSLPLTYTTADDLIAEPILTWIGESGGVSRFEARSELQQALPGVDLRECIDLIMPPIATASLRVGATWTRDVPVEFPAKPLHDKAIAPMKMQLVSKITEITRHGGKLCARINVQGHFTRDKLEIPIREEEIKYLIWTTQVLSIEDTLTGEILLDLEQKIARKAEFDTAYRYSTRAGRKADNFRGRIDTDNSIRAKFTADLTTGAPQLSAARN